MPYTLFDLSGLALAVLLTVVVLVLPGYAIAAKTNVLGFATASNSDRIALALLVAYAVMPVLSSMAARFVNLNFAAFLSLALSAIALHHARGDVLPRLSRGAWIALAAGFAVLAALWIDFAWNGRLYPSLLIVDVVKHAATVRALVEAGSAPSADPFFLRDSLVSYYYFYYTPSALIEILGFGLIDSRAAVGGQLFWTGLATIGLIKVLAERSGVLRAGVRAPLPLIIGLMAAGGLQIVVVALLWWGFDLPWPAQLGWHTEEMTSWLLSMIWVPHHLAALISSWCGFLLLLDAQKTFANYRAAAVGVVVAGFAFASACGLSTWVTIGAVATVAVWAVSDALRRRWRGLALLAMAGVIALIVAAPHLFDLLRYRSYGDFPIGFQIRIFSFADLAGQAFGERFINLFRLIALPLNYFSVTGIMFIGSVIFWRKRLAHHGREFSEIERVIAYSAASTLIIGSFFASKIINNDLGWRVVLFLQVASLLWTLSVMMPLWRRAGKTSVSRVVAKSAPRSLMAIMALGYLSVAHDLIAMRAFNQLGMLTDDPPRDPRVDYEARQAYTWLARHAPHAQVFQHNPNLNRAMAYGLYGRHRTAIADAHNSKLFGPSKADVANRLATFRPMFASVAAAEDVRKTLTAEGVDAVVVASTDPVWLKHAPWVFASPAMFATSNIRVLSTRDLRDKP